MQIELLLTGKKKSGRGEKDEKKEGEKELIFLKVSPAALERRDFPFRPPPATIGHLAHISLKFANVARRP